MRKLIEKLIPTYENIYRVGAMVTKDPVLKMMMYRAAERCSILGPKYKDDTIYGHVLNDEDRQILRDRWAKHGDTKLAAIWRHLYSPSHGTYNAYTNVGLYIEVQHKYEYFHKGNYYEFHKVLKPRIVYYEHGSRYAGKTVVSYTLLKKYLKTLVTSQVPCTLQLPLTNYAKKYFVAPGCKVVPRCTLACLVDDIKLIDRRLAIGQDKIISFGD